MKTGGPALYNRTGDTQHFYEWHYGMTLRDWFAGMALQGLLASPANNTLRGEAPETSFQLSEMAYSTADAMIKEREK